MRQPEPERRHRLGNYGAGTLWSVKSRSGVCIFFNDTPIARRGKRRGLNQAWMALDASWKVTMLPEAEVLVQHDGSEGVVLSLLGDANDSWGRAK
jgi:hypothetical protein